MALLYVLDLSKAAKKPYGHTSYTRRSKTGKVSYVKAKGAKPVEAPAVKKISDIKPGEKVHTESNMGGYGPWRLFKNIYDYSHVLPQEQRAHYKLFVEHKGNKHNTKDEIEAERIFVKIYKKDVDIQQADYRNHIDVGSIDSYVVPPNVSRSKRRALELHSQLDEEHQGKGLGSAMYEAAYAYAKNVRGIDGVFGGMHSEKASAVHKRLAKKYGFDYLSEKRTDAGTDAQYPYGDYEYTIKSENLVKEKHLFGPGKGIIFIRSGKIKKASSGKPLGGRAHIAYTRVSRTGKVSFIQSKGVKINERYSEKHGELEDKIIDHLKEHAKKITDEDGLLNVLDNYLEENFSFESDKHRGKYTKKILDELYQTDLLDKEEEQPKQSGIKNIGLPKKKNPTWKQQIVLSALDRLFKTFDEKKTSLVINGTKVSPPSPEAELCAIRVAACLGDDAKEIESDFKLNMLKSLAEHWKVKHTDNFDFKHYHKRKEDEKAEAVALRAEEKAKGVKRPKREPLFAMTDGEQSKLAGGSIPGGTLFRAKADKKRHGNFVPLIKMKDCTFNGSSKPPGWTGKVVAEKDKQWLVKYVHPETGKEGYIYTAKVLQANQLKNWDKALKIGENLPELRTHMKDHFSDSDAKVRASAIVTFFMDKAQLRVGGDEGKERDTYGASTLQARHIIWEGPNTVRLKFRGKSAVPWNRVLTLPPEVAKALKGFTDGKKEKQPVFPVNDSDVNKYLKSYSMTAKQFRPWHANRYLDAYMGELEAARKKHNLTSEDMEMLWDGVDRGEHRKLAQIAHAISTKLSDSQIAPGLKIHGEYYDEKKKKGKTVTKYMVGVLPYVAHILGHDTGTCRKNYIDPRRFLGRCAKWGFDARTTAEVNDNLFENEVTLKKALRTVSIDSIGNRDKPDVFGTDLLEHEYEIMQKLWWPGRDLLSEPDDELVKADLIKSRPKGSRNKKVKYIARYQDSRGNWKYILPHEKETDEEGKLLSDVKPSSILRHYFGIETESDRRKRSDLGIKDVKDTIKWTRNTRGNWVREGEGAEVITAFEVAPDYERDFRNGIPQNISQFFTSPEDLASIHEAQAKVPTKGESTPPAHVIIPLKDDEGKNLLDVHGKPIPIGKHGLSKEDLKRLHVEHVEQLSDKPPEIAEGGGIHGFSGERLSPMPLVTTKIKRKPENQPASYWNKVKDVLADPVVLAKYGGSLAALQADLRDRPFTVWMTAGMMGGPNLHPSAKEAVLNEWMHTILKIARAETGRFKNTPYYTSHAAGEDEQQPQPRGGIAEHYIKQNLRDYIQDVTLQAFTDWLPNYQAKDNPEDRFDKWFASRIDNYIRDRIKRDLRERGAEVSLTGDENELGRPDVGAGSKAMSPADYVEYKHYAPIGRKRIQDALDTLPEAHRRIVAARLWLDGPESEDEERQEISVRTVAKINFERSFPDILAKYPDMWPFKVDMSTPKGVETSVKSASRFYQKAIAALAQNLTASPIDQQLAHEGKTHGLVYDPNSNRYFTKENYAAKRYLELETKRVQSGRSIPSQITPYSKEGQGPSVLSSKFLKKPRKKQIADLIPAVGFFEKHPVLKQRLGFDWGTIRMPSTLFSGNKPLRYNPVEYSIKPEHYIHGLPQTQHKTRPMVMTPEQSRRFHVLRDYYTFMLTISHKKPKELASLREKSMRVLSRTKAVLGIETPATLINSIRAYAGHIGNQNDATRETAKKLLHEHATKLFQVERILGVPDDQTVSHKIRDIISKPIDTYEGGQRRAEALAKLGYGETISAISSRLNLWNGRVIMIDYHTEQRTKMKKAIFAPVEDYTVLLHNLDFAIGCALA